MSGPAPTTPVRLPKAVSTYSPATHDPDLRSQINTALLRDGHVQKISDQLSHSLHASPTNWPANIRSHALTLLRSGECVTFPELMARVMADVQADSNEHESGGDASNSGSKSKVPNGSNGTNGSGAGEGEKSLAIPREVVEEGLKVTRECLEMVCEVDT